MDGANSASAPARNGAFQSVPAQNIHRGVFDLSHEKKLTFDFGQLIPTLCMEMVPGDIFEISNDVVVRFQAMIAPPLHQVDLSIHYFFVPNRLVWPKIDQSGNDWETFITGGVLGTNSAVMPRWNVNSGNHDVGSLWDYFGLPTWSTANNFTTQFPDAIQPIELPMRAYNLIWNEYYRDETLQTTIDPINLNNSLLYRNWTKDFFTSALPWTQRGTSPAFPVSGSTSAVWAASVFPNATLTNPGALSISTTSNPDNRIGNQTPTAIGAANTLGAFNANSVSLSGATTFTINDFRLNTVIQRLLERNARSGIRYTEFLQSNYGVHPHDARLQRPEYIGGIKQPVIFSEVLQTSNTTGAPTPPATMLGHGLTVGRNYAGKYRAEEFGYMMGIMSVMPVPSYQQGMEKKWLRTSKYDFFFPEFAGLGEQAVLNQELYLANDSANQTIFGYQGRYNEYRYQRNSVHGLFQSTLNYWHLGRIFSSRPALNSAFIALNANELTSTTLKRIFATPSQPGLLASVGNNIKAIRPIPEFGEPGLYRI
ncbi:MAG: major capsid protein [Microvirus sp.]|nr:MAG: major capsid protein [Microvirus sp.]